MPHPLIYRLPLASKIALAFCGILVLILSTLWVLTTNDAERALQQQADRLGETLARQTADAVRELVLANDLLGLNVATTQLVDNGSIARITVFNIDDQVLARAGSSATLSENTSIHNAEVTLQDAVAGYVQLELDRDALAGASSIHYYFWATLGLGLLLAIAIAFALGSHIITPLNNLSAALEDPDESGIKEPEPREDEIARLQLACKNLLEKYQETRSHQLNLSGMTDTKRAKVSAGSSKVMASLLVIKVVNVNTAIELLHPNTLSALLNEYQIYLKQAGRLYGGNVLRFSGDSALASFDTRACGEDHSFNAICCAQLFLLLMHKVGQVHRAQKAQVLQFRLSIHSGETFFCKTGAVNEVGETLLGKTMETAYFLCKQSHPGQLLISESTYSQAGAESKLPGATSIEITMPTDNMSFTAYILGQDMGNYSGLLQKQLQHILPDNA